MADIEGAEFDLFSHEDEALQSVEMAIVELHPREYLRRGRSEEAMLDLIGRAGFVVVERRADVVLLRRGQAGLSCGSERIAGGTADTTTAR